MSKLLRVLKGRPKSYPNYSKYLRVAYVQATSINITCCMH